LIAVKAVDLLLQAFADLLKQLPGKALQLDIVGKGPLRSSMELLCKQLKINKFVNFYGLLDHRAVAAKMQASQCLVLSSTIETFGVVLAEAMACGIPAIATDCGGPSDLITPETGLLAPVGDVEAYTACMKRMVEHYHGYDAYTIRQSAVRRFGHENVCKRWIDLYKQALRKPAL
jgi:L-malate glycosyltransferase